MSCSKMSEKAVCKPGVGVVVLQEKSFLRVSGDVVCTR